MKKKLSIVLFLSFGLFLGYKGVKVVNANNLSTTSTSIENSTENSTLTTSTENTSTSTFVSTSESVLPSSTVSVENSSTLVVSSTDEIVEEEKFDLGKWLESIFTKEFLANLGSIGVSLLAVLKVAKDNKILSTQKITTPKEIAEMVKTELEKQEYNNFETYIKTETLSEEIIEKDSLTEEFDLNGKLVKLDVEKVA